MSINTITVIGANGNMGSKIAAIFASFGNAKTYLVARDKHAAERAIPAAVKSVRANCIEARLIPKDYDALEACVAESDLIFESVAERLDVKRDVLKRINESANPGTFICTGTSGLSIETLASTLSESLRRTFMGVHFFNPPYAMPLCELISHPECDPEAVDFIERYLSGTLMRRVVRTSDSPAFLANRIGFHTINRAMRLAEHEADSGGIDYIDSILGPFTGRAMAPLRTADFVGLDVHAAIVDNIIANSNDCFKDDFEMPRFAKELIANGRLGAKTGQGLYRKDGDTKDKKTVSVWDIASGDYRPTEHYALRFADYMVSSLKVGDYEGAAKALCANTSHEAGICLEALIAYVAYAAWCSLEVAGSPAEADDVMAHGFNWCPPLAIAEWLGSAVDVRELVASYLETAIGQGKAAEVADAIVPTKYDYRRYLRARR